jgi:hypothetical protein
VDSNHKWIISETIRRSLRGIVDAPIDVIVARQEQIERYRDRKSLIYHTALTQGKLCYQRES